MCDDQSNCRGGSYDERFEDDLALLSGEGPAPRREAVFPEGWRCPGCRTIYNPNIVTCSGCSKPHSFPTNVPGAVPGAFPPFVAPVNPPSFIPANIPGRDYGPGVYITTAGANTPSNGWQYMEEADAA